MAVELEIKRTKDEDDYTTPALELKEFLCEMATREIIDELFDEELDEDKIKLLTMLNLTSRTLDLVHEQKAEIGELKNKINELCAKVEVLEVERRFEHNKDGG